VRFYLTVFKYVMASVIAIVLVACDSTVPPTFVKEGDTYRRYQVHYDADYKKEQWNDPDVLSTPRVQFTWTKPEDDPDDINNLGIWSMKLDGTDLRQVATPEELMPKHLEQSRYRPEVPFVRSPDNRYIAYAMAHGIRYERRLLDLETKQVTVLTDRGGPPDFMWFKGGRYLTFSGPGSLMQYDMQTQEPAKDIVFRFGTNYIRRAFAYDNGNQLVNFSDETAIFYDYDTGKVLDKIPATYGVLTLDGKHWIKYSKGHNTYATPVKDPEAPVYKYPKGVISSPLEAISATGTIVSGGVRVVTYQDDKITVFRLPGKGYIGNTAIYNAAAVLNKTAQAAQN
jgi:hypothetical protein